MASIMLTPCAASIIQMVMSWERVGECWVLECGGDLWRLGKVSGSWVLSGRGLAWCLGKRATFDHAEGIIAKAVAL